MQRRPLLGMALMAAATVTHREALAQPAYPSRPVRLIVPYPAGGGVDVAARILAEPVARRLGQPVIIDNRSGAGGAIGTEAMANAPADGYTLVVSVPGPITVGPNLRPHPYSVATMTHVLRIVLSPLVLIARRDLPADDVAGLVQLVRQRPEGIRYASGGAGTGTHMTGELFALRAGGRMLHVPYRGAAPAVTDLMAGQVDIYFSDTSAIALVRQGQVKALGVTTKERWPGLPEVPALNETLDGFDISNWYGISAPAGTPADIVARLDAAFRAALAEPDVVSRLATTGFMPAPLGSREFSAFIAAESRVWAEVIEKAGIRIDN